VGILARMSAPREKLCTPLNDVPNKKLSDRLRERITREGPIPFHDWMQAALYDEREGYYCRRDRIRQGRAGDYRTAPEISPLFGGAFAHYFMKSYFDLGAPKQWTIVDVGGGSGDFARGVLSSLQRNSPRVFDTTRYVIDEVSADAQSQTLTKIGEFKDRVQFRRLSEITGALPYAIIFSNELLDAFPVHRVIGRGGMLRELYVGLNDRADFIWTEGDLDPRVVEYCTHIQLQLAERQIYEVNLDAEEFIARGAKLIDQGLLITVDYGAQRNQLLDDPNRFGGTLRAFHRHRFGEDVLSHPGEQDLTTTVDWNQVMEAGARNGLETLRFEPLNEFLMTEGALNELMNAGNRITDTAELLNYNAKARELIMPNGMAAAFQVLVQRKAA
jgi:SAM-dependent MidA family methyltransferase